MSVAESATYLYKRITADPRAEVRLPFRPFKQKMPQNERVHLAVEDANGTELYTTELTLGNGYLKNWKYAVSKTEEIDTTDLNFVPSRDQNPWGYVYLYQYLNMQENGICPVDFIEIIQKIGYGYARVTIDSDFEGDAVLRLRADEGSVFLLNGKEIYRSDRYTVETDVPIRFERGDNLLEARLNWRSPRPFTGREFGLSAQVLSTDGKVIGTDAFVLKRMV